MSSQPKPTHHHHRLQDVIDGARGLGGVKSSRRAQTFLPNTTFACLSWPCLALFEPLLAKARLTTALYLPGALSVNVTVSLSSCQSPPPPPITYTTSGIFRRRGWDEKGV